MPSNYLANVLDIVRALKVCIIGRHEFGLAYLDVTFVVGVPALYYRYHIGVFPTFGQVYTLYYLINGRYYYFHETHSYHGQNTPFLNYYES